MAKIMDNDYAPRRSAGVSERTRRQAEKFRQSTGCPRCGGSTTRRAGLTVCQSCGHQLGTQHAERFKSDYGQVIRPHQAGLLGAAPTDPVDDEDRMTGFPRGRRNQPLEFEE